MTGIVSRIEQMADALERLIIGRWTRPNPPPTGLPASGMGHNGLYLPVNSYWRKATYISIGQAVEALQFRWTSATPDEARQALALLENYAVRRTSKSGDAYKILRPDPVPPVHTGPAPKPLAKGEGLYDYRRKVKPGLCKKCGVKVANPNRHNNPLHTGDACKLNVIKQILEE